MQGQRGGSPRPVRKDASHPVADRQVVPNAAGFREAPGPELAQPAGPPLQPAVIERAEILHV